MTKTRLSLDDLSPCVREQFSVQRYPPAAVIDGVRLVDLREIQDDGGSFVELARIDEAAQVAGFEGFQARQVNYSTMMPGTVNAWHLHFGQEDIWFVPSQSRILVGLKDIRANSPTEGLSMRFVLGAGRARLLLIPRGVAHGAANPWPGAQVVIYFVNQQFSPQAPDEGRLPWDAFGADFWELTRG